MRVKFSEDVVPLTDLKVNPGRVIKHVTEAHRQGRYAKSSIMESGRAHRTPTHGAERLACGAGFS
jgi:hypothetical protein